MQRFIPACLTSNPQRRFWCRVGDQLPPAISARSPLSLALRVELPGSDWDWMDENCSITRQLSLKFGQLWHNKCCELINACSISNKLHELMEMAPTRDYLSRAGSLVHVQLALNFPAAQYCFWTRTACCESGSRLQCLSRPSHSKLVNVTGNVG